MTVREERYAGLSKFFFSSVPEAELLSILGEPWKNRFQTAVNFLNVYAPRRFVKNLEGMPRRGVTDSADFAHFRLADLPPNTDGRPRKIAE